MKPFPVDRARHKILSQDILIPIIHRAKAKGCRIVFTNGCFDLLHAGHVNLLERSRRLGDLLIVAINSDRSVRVLKGPQRPLVGQRDRSVILAALACVNYVTIFHERTPERLIERLQPDVLVKGGDWDRQHIVGSQILKRTGGRVVRVPLLKGRSTSTLIERIRQRIGKPRYFARGAPHPQP